MQVNDTSPVMDVVWMNVDCIIPFGLQKHFVLFFYARSCLVWEISQSSHSRYESVLRKIFYVEVHFPE